MVSIYPIPILGNPSDLGAADPVVLSLQIFNQITGRVLSTWSVKLTLAFPSSGLQQI